MSKTLRVYPADFMQIFTPPNLTKIGRMRFSVMLNTNLDLFFGLLYQTVLMSCVDLNHTFG